MVRFCDITAEEYRELDELDRKVSRAYAAWQDAETPEERERAEAQYRWVLRQRDRYESGAW